MGTPHFSAEILNFLLKLNYNIVAVVTQNDKPSGRKKEIIFSEVKQVALDNGIEVIQPTRIRKDYKRIVELEPDLVITCAYGQILPEELLKIPKFGCINIHASLLPKLRGGAPIHRAIIDGHLKTGITLMMMDAGMDTGDIITQDAVPITLEDTVATLSNKLIECGKQLLFKNLEQILNGDFKLIKQDNNLATYALNIQKKEEFISFDREYMVVYNHIRGLIPQPYGYGVVETERIKLLEVALSDITSEGSNGLILPAIDNKLAVVVNKRVLLINKVQFQGKGIINAKDFYNGRGRNLIGKCFK